MHHRGSPTTHGHSQGAGEERRLTATTFVGSYPAADFRTNAELPQIAFVGRSNVGKSSLLNKIIGRRALAHTSKTPGKTRTLNLYSVNESFFLVDLPGYGYARVSKKERRGFSKLIQEYLTTRKELIGVVWLLDIRRDPSNDDLEIADLLASRSLPSLIAITKADKVSRGKRGARVRAIANAAEVPESFCLVTSARTKEGIGDLVGSIDALVEDSGGKK